MKRLIIPAIAACLFFSCQSSSEEEKNTTSEEVDSTTIKTDSLAIAQEEHAVSYNLPSALQVASVFKKSGAAYLSSVTNDKSNISRYNTSNYKKAVNFGIYSADLAYCLSSKKYQESKEYLKACKDLGAYLGINKAFENDRIPERFDQNISNEDSLIHLVSGIQQQTDMMFEENKQKHIKLLALVGAWTESLYIAGEVYAKDKSKKVRSNLLEQLLFSNTILKALNGYKATEPEITALISAVENIRTGFAKMPTVGAAMEKDENTDFNTLVIPDSELSPVLQSIKALRNGMVN